MKWEQVGEKLAKHGLNLLADAVPGSRFVTGLVSDVLGADNTPDSVDKALMTANPELIIKLKEMEIEKEADLKIAIINSNTDRIRSVNETMRAEATAEAWWQSGWRPYWGFVSGTAFLFVCIIVLILAWKAVDEKDLNAINMIPQIITSITTLFTIPGAILGIAAWGRNKEKIQRLVNLQK